MMEQEFVNTFMEGSDVTTKRPKLRTSGIYTHCSEFQASLLRFSYLFMELFFQSSDNPLEEMTFCIQPMHETLQ